MAREFFARCGVQTPIPNGCVVYSANGCLVGCSPSLNPVIIAGAGTSSSLRCGVNNVASGNFSGSFGGSCNTASGLYSNIVGGFKNQTNAIQGFIGGGICNNACNSTNGCLSFGATVVGGVGNNTSQGTWSLASCSFTSPPTICNAGLYSFIGGGFQNRATSDLTTIGGGFCNVITSGCSTIAGGCGNSIGTSSGYSAIGGGRGNLVCNNGIYGVVAGGFLNNAGAYGAIGGGRGNTASSYGTVAGGFCNISIAGCSFVGGGFGNCACCAGSVATGGRSNVTLAPLGTIGGGVNNYVCNLTCLGVGATVAGGVGNNTTGGTWDVTILNCRFTVAPTACAVGCMAFIGGGFQNVTTACFASVVGGCCNIASGCFSTISGGYLNIASGIYSSASGYNNSSICGYSIVKGGNNNISSEAYGVILGGSTNISSGAFSLITNGYLNTASSKYSGVFHGVQNTASNYYTTVINGLLNCAVGCYSAILGGESNVTNGIYSGAFGCGLTASCACTWYTNNSCSCGTIASSCLTSNQVLCAGAGGVVQSTNWGYGSFSSSACQAIACTTTAYAMTFDCVEIANGVALQCSSQLRVLQSGVYNLAFSAQVIHAAGGDASASIWFQCNGADIPRSNTDVTINGNNSAYVAAWNIMTCMNANDYLEIYWRATDIDVSLLSCAAQVSPTRPETPSLIATLNRVF